MKKIFKTLTVTAIKTRIEEWVSVIKSIITLIVTLSSVLSIMSFLERKA